MPTHLQKDVLYLYALSLLKGIGQQTVLRIVRTIADLSDLPQLSHDDLQKRLGMASGNIVFQSLHHDPTTWQHALAHAESELFRHLEQGIIPLPITHASYPSLLKLIPDPPPILYAKGNIVLLRDIKAIAIIGTRQPTSGGIQVAHDLAYQLARRHYTIVSGLAKGIDIVAHQGALDAQGNTIAVFGTPLDTIYPAQHRHLADRILAEYGLIVSELALGQQSFQTAFVRRDRIQSGLSLAVLPIQTRNEGGTMHTIQFARTQNRLIVCPKPPSAEAHLPQYEGIKTLINEGAEKTHSFLFHRVSYGKLLSLFQTKSHDLLPETQENQMALATELFPYLAPASIATLISEQVDSAQHSSLSVEKRLRKKVLPASTSSPLPRITEPLIQCTPTMMRETQELFLSSHSLTRAQTPLGLSENREVAPLSDNSPPSQARSLLQSRQGKRPHKEKELPLWEFAEGLDEQETVKQLRKLDSCEIQGTTGDSAKFLIIDEENKEKEKPL